MPDQSDNSDMLSVVHVGDFSYFCMMHLKFPYKHIVTMNKTYITLISSLLISCSSAAAPEQPAPAPDGRQFSGVIAPEVPLQLEFCGDVIDLDRTDMWERFDRELSSVTYTHGTTMLILKRANRLFPEIAPILERNRIPADILYLACVESSLNPRAVSPAKAAGLWQFIPETAKQYGLEVNDEIDERYNLEKATAAACRYLRQAYNKYGNWESVMASYNAGQGRISRELDAQLASSSFDLYLNDETSRYVFRIMAMKEVLEHPRQYGFLLNADQLYQPVEYGIVTVNGPVADWPAWAKEQGITYAVLREYNPWIRSKKLTNRTGKAYQVRIPKAKSLKRSTQDIKTYNPDWVD